ncbi:MAG: hypothetical protein D6718_03650 [Acidobacteria bacterium]|nr:MAG: hypothetical protein D6718_03650 [Acidobacteriota bacterium]
MPSLPLLLILGLQVLFNLAVLALVVLLLRREPRGVPAATPRAGAKPRSRETGPPPHLAGLVAQAERGEELVAEAGLKERLARFAQGAEG